MADAAAPSPRRADPPLSLGVLAHSRKENEHRLPIHPRHLADLDPALRGSIHLEHGYGERFGVTDADLLPFVARIASRAELIADCDVILLPKVQAEDLEEMREGQTVWGWPHCVQDPVLTQVAIDRRLTLIAFEAMNHWTADGRFALHVFHMNNELAGYCSVLHALELAGRTGAYGRRLTATVIGFGATARGAVTALNAHGVTEVNVLTNRDVAAVGSPIPGTWIVQLEHDEATGTMWAQAPDGRVSVAEFLADSDIVVNCVLQDPEAPLMFLDETDLKAFPADSIIVDVSCDEGMGFSWARPTTFDDPSFLVGASNLLYYAVDHSPSLLWDSASWEISSALLPHLEVVLGGPAAWDGTSVVSRAIEIRDGEVVNPAVLSFQHRADAYPHPVLPVA
ncbi:alanine dehydrogenase [Aeromicrobium flavum]|uniref:Alanine dehydrogenase n=1 Tax=Aeromicrobium flavum TaxID=416568 RepID=A0A512HTF0_9ACTN|nr:N(5)-(carboxyethyl)ornithine synthase [Aeromicrobium flavum]GEO88732.1 alanine dehydrogenase [Aeromicrobium flavum]